MVEEARKVLPSSRGPLDFMLGSGLMATFYSDDTALDLPRTHLVLRIFYSKPAAHRVVEEDVVDGRSRPLSSGVVVEVDG